MWRGINFAIGAIQMKDLPIIPQGYASFPEIPQGLALIAQNRDNILTHELALATNTASQTIRKHLCQTGSFHGIVPIKIGGKLQFPVSEVAKLVRGESV